MGMAFIIIPSILLLFGWSSYKLLSKANYPLPSLDKTQLKTRQIWVQDETRDHIVNQVVLNSFAESERPDPQIICVTFSNSRLCISKFCTKSLFFKFLLISKFCTKSAQNQSSLFSLRFKFGPPFVCRFYISKKKYDFEKTQRNRANLYCFKI